MCSALLATCSHIVPEGPVISPLKVWTLIGSLAVALLVLPAATASADVGIAWVGGTVNATADVGPAGFNESYSDNLTIVGQDLAEPGGPCATSDCEAFAQTFIACPGISVEPAIFFGSQTATYPEGTEAINFTASHTGIFPPHCWFDHFVMVVEDINDTTTTQSNSIPASNNVVDGIDATPYVALPTGPPDTCIGLSVLPDHAAGSSESDEELTCEADLAAGKSVLATITDIMSTYGPITVDVWVTYEDPDNPSSNPPPASTIDSIARHIIDDSPSDSDIPTESDTDIETTAKDCQELAVQASLTGAIATGSHDNPCEHLPIFMPGSDVPTVAQADYNAITSTPSWFQLHYRSQADNPGYPGNRGWYRSDPACSGLPSGTSCQEYPYYASLEGGPGANPAVSLTPVNSGENTTEGLRLANMVNTSECHMTSDPVNTPFLVVPLGASQLMGSAAPATDYSCGDQ